MVFYRDKDLHLYVIVDAVEAIELHQFSFVPSLAIPHNTKSNKSIIFLKVFASMSTQDYQSNLPTTGHGWTVRLSGKCGRLPDVLTVLYRTTSPYIKNAIPAP